MCLVIELFNAKNMRHNDIVSCKDCNRIYRSRDRYEWHYMSSPYESVVKPDSRVEIVNLAGFSIRCFIIFARGRDLLNVETTYWS